MQKKHWLAIGPFVVLAATMSGCPDVNVLRDASVGGNATVQGDEHIGGNLEVGGATVFDGPVTFEDGFNVTGGEIQVDENVPVNIDGPVEVNNTIIADDFEVDETPNDNNPPPPPPPPPPDDEMIEIVGAVTVSGIHRVGMPIAFKIPTNGVGGAINFRLPGQLLTSSVEVLDGAGEVEITFIFPFPFELSLAYFWVEGTDPLKASTAQLAVTN